MTDDHAEFGGSLDVDIVGADAVADENLAPAKPLQHRAAHLEAPAQDPVGLLTQAQRLFERHPIGVGELASGGLDDATLVAGRRVPVLDEDDAEWRHARPGPSQMLPSTSSAPAPK